MANMKRACVILIPLVAAACGPANSGPVGVHQTAVTSADPTSDPCYDSRGPIADAEIAKKWVDLGGVNSPLGHYATVRHCHHETCSFSCVPSVEVGPNGIGLMQQFVHGRIYWSESTTLTVDALWGDILQEYLATGGADSTTFRLGFPTTDVVSKSNGSQYVLFSGWGNNASITWTPATGAHEVHDLFRSKWGELGWEDGCLGYPISDDITSSDGVEHLQNFQNGWLSWSPGQDVQLHGCGIIQ
jgi:uncharacterized protein with LGFP repeats